MLAKEKRLNLKKDFKWVVSGKRLETKYTRLYVRMGDNPHPRVSVAPASKNFKKATDRNRAKRIIWAAFKALYPALLPNLNIVALPKLPVLGVKSGDMLLDLEEVLMRERMLNKK
ncbi:ribonuclease P protein component [Candidatus Daviesbacteria bacterium]|nr:ribonuclease P protein component [Candidatus Daviesbacteria bacterium]